MDNFEWAAELSCAVTVCDREGFVLYQNLKAKKTFDSYGDLIGKSLKDCHGERSWRMIEDMLNSGGSNSYTIEKNGVKKLIHQTPWHKNGKICGLVEFSIEIPQQMPHFIR